MINSVLPKQILSNDITLNVLPDSHPHIPAVVGRVPYATTVKLLQFLVTTLLIPPSSKLMILSARTDSHPSIFRYSYYRAHDTAKEPQKDEQHSRPTTTDPDQEAGHHGHHHHRLTQSQAVKSRLSSGLPPRFIVYWRTVSPEDYEMKTRTSSSSKDEDTTEYFPYSWSSSLTKEVDALKIARSLGILPHEYPVLTGIFEFDFDDTCTSIITHTITDLEYLTKPTSECVNPA
ncbi:hypothetical protein AWJ20_120 [Sugiyamaella lignohabitans]|uniref:Uncharacterized protein n=1 Tax=Sugiyamaella lignohabitans TaxID=796027 RepID=A0A167CMN5_9ASCO|nr:uncharacterized protein AWJ20_120 [Sugiyamaella lignohabitans]ANB11893.1 hypothetical protein AWJ20_120 [Sugiyamaella lignohabitans]